MNELNHVSSTTKLGEMRYANNSSLSPIGMQNAAVQGIQSRLRRLQEVNSLSRKVKSYKKHFPQNINSHSELKQFGILRDGGRLESKHDKLQIKDIIGTSPNQFQTDVFKNRLYGKGVDREHIFQKQRQQNSVKKQQKDFPREQTSLVPSIKFSAKQSDYSLPKYANSSGRKGYHIEHVLDINLNRQQTHRHINPESSSAKMTPQRRIKTEMDSNFDINRSNIFNYEKESREITSSLLRKWNPTHLTERFNPLILKLPKLA